jgi:predicted flap endonuclease-1-like 5' DNA nuclease
MTLSFLPEVPKIDPEKGPNLIAGAASPLWLVFGGAAMAGATWWWWSARWREAINVEALMAPSLALKAELVVEPVIDPVTEAPILAPVALETPKSVTAAVAEVAAEAVRETLDTTETVVAGTAETVEATAEPVVKAAKVLADDLTVVVGIGPKLAASLAELGVTRFADLAAWGPKELADFDARLNLRGRAERDAWVAQAKRLANP